MVKGSRYMIHNGMTLAFGNRHEMQAMFNILQSFDAELASEYAARTKGEPSKMTAWMDAETWFTADEALENGFIDKVNPNSQESVKALTQWDLSAYANAPKPIEQPEPDLSELVTAQLQNNRNRMRLLTQRNRI